MASSATWKHGSRLEGGGVLPLPAWLERDERGEGKQRQEEFYTERNREMSHKDSVMIDKER